MSERDRGRSWEAAFVLLGVAALCTVLLNGHGRAGLALEISLAVLSYAMAIRWCARREGRAAERSRAALSYLYALWFYGASSRIVSVCGMPLHDGQLLRVDEWLLRSTPAVPLARLARPWLTEVMSACYLGYLVYLHGSLLWTFLRSPEKLRRWCEVVLPGFVTGFIGYLLLPARGPAAAFPALFPPAVEGGFFTQLNAAIVAQGNAIYGVFPSLHVLITLLLLRFDSLECRTRFWWMLAPAAGLFVSTIYLGYHYAADLLAAGLLFILLICPIPCATRRS